jgi:hypothetical protein
MKPQLFLPAFIMLTILILNQANAQQVAVNYTSGKHFKTANNKVVNAASVSTKNNMFNNINMSAMRDFTTKYKDVNNASWYEANGGYVAKFTAGEATTTVTYKKNGEWFYTITGYSEKKMPKEVRALVKSTYYDYTIVNIEEIQVPNKDNNIFLVNVQDATTIKVIRVCDGEMQVLHDYTKG